MPEARLSTSERRLLKELGVQWMEDYLNLFRKEELFLSFLFLFSWEFVNLRICENF